MSGYALHPEEFNDIDEIRAYIAEDNPDAADRVVEEIFAIIRTLQTFPQQGFRRPNLRSRAVRFTIVRDYVIAYAAGTTPLYVLAVFHGRRSPRVIAAILRGRQ